MKRRIIEQLTKEMKAAARLLEFEHAAYLRDRIKKLKIKNDIVKLMYNNIK